METPRLPDRYRDHLRGIGGSNHYGEPIFILQWGPSPIPRFSGCPEMYIMPTRQLAQGLQCWVLAQWKSAEEMGDPELYTFPTEYGVYVPMQVFKDGPRHLELDTEGLNLEVLSLFVWVVLNHEHDSMQKRTLFLDDTHAAQEKAKRQQLIDRIEDGAPAFAGPCSFHGQLNVNSVVLQKMEQIQKNLERISDRARQFPRGGILQQSVV